MERVYESLLLSSGGGITCESQLALQNPQTAALVIGLGGTGVRAAQMLKQKVYERLVPDNPGAAEKRYDHIQFLAIDSDDIDVVQMKGEARIDLCSEYCSISDPQLSISLDVPREIDRIKANPLLNWFDVDSIRLCIASGAGGVRQVGRFLMFQNAGRLRCGIEEKIRRALAGRSTRHLDVYIYTGLSGGTGSGALFDICYMVRNIAETSFSTSSVTVFGLLFTPDVVLSKVGMASNPAAMQINMSNGYAALRELDYFMHLKEEGKRFHQDYGTFAVDTDERPIDICYLLSATDANGVVVEDAPTTVLDTAASLVMTFLHEDSQASMPNGAMCYKPSSIEGFHASALGISPGFPMYPGYPTYYTVGVGEASIPVRQFLTYLACGMFHKTSSMIGREINQPTVDKIKELACNLGFDDAESLKAMLVRDAPGLHLPDFADDSRALLEYGLLDRAVLPSEWRSPGQQWLDESARLRKETAAKLLTPLDDSYDLLKAWTTVTDSIVTRTFVSLCDAACDPNRGPYYAASLLRNGQYALQSRLMDVKAEAEWHAAACRTCLEGTGSADGLYDRKFEANEAYLSPKFPVGLKKGLAKYYESVVAIVKLIDEEDAWRETARVAQQLSDRLEAMYEDFFGPLADCFDRLIHTFESNDGYLHSPQALSQSSHDAHMVELLDVKTDLDNAFGNLTEAEYVTGLVRCLIESPACFMRNDEPALKKVVCDYVNSIPAFQAIFHGNMDLILLKGYQGSGDSSGRPNIAWPIDKLQSGLFDVLYNAATPLFFCSSSYDIADSLMSLPFIDVSIPNDSRLLTKVSNDFAQRQHSRSRVWQVFSPYHMSIVRHYACLPIVAYAGLSSCKEAYDVGAQSVFGEGAHLFAHTGRGGDYDIDWRHELPDISGSACFFDGGILGF